MTTPEEPADAGCGDDIHAVLDADETGAADEPDHEDVAVDGDAAGEGQP